MPGRKPPSAKQRAARKAWAERRDARERSEAWRRGEEGSGAVPLDGETSWSLATKPRAFDTVVADMRAAQGVKFAPGHCWPPAADGRPVTVIVGHADGTFSEIAPTR